MAKQKLFYFQAYDQRQQWQKGSLVAQSKQAAQFLLIAKGFSRIRLQQDWGNLIRNLKMLRSVLY